MRGHKLLDINKLSVFRCSLCKKTRKVKFFCRYKRKLKHGKTNWYFNSWCKDCKIKRRKKYERKSPKYNRHPSAAKRLPGRTRYILYEYGLDEVSFDVLRKKQNNRCAICFRRFRNRKDTQIDHHHTNGSIRGLLCRTCNLGLGYFRDNQEILKKALVYLKDRSSIRFLNKAIFMPEKSFVRKHQKPPKRT